MNTAGRLLEFLFLTPLVGIVCALDFFLQYNDFTRRGRLVRLAGLMIGLGVGSSTFLFLTHQSWLAFFLCFVLSMVIVERFDYHFQHYPYLNEAVQQQVTSGLEERERGIEPLCAGPAPRGSLKGLYVELFNERSSKALQSPTDVARWKGRVQQISKQLLRARKALNAPQAIDLEREHPIFQAKRWDELLLEGLPASLLHRFAIDCAKHALTLASETDPRCLQALESKQSWLLGETNDEAFIAAIELAKQAEAECFRCPAIRMVADVMAIDAKQAAQGPSHSFDCSTIEASCNERMWQLARLRYLAEVWSTCGERSLWLLHEDKCPLEWEAPKPLILRPPTGVMS